MNTSDRADQLMTFSQAAVLLQISLRQFRRLVDDGKLAIVRVTPRTPRVRAHEVDAFIAASTERRAETS